MFRRHLLLLALLVPVLTACDDDDPAGPSSATLAGNWTVTQIELVSVANASISVDLMDEGVTATLELEADGDFFLRVTDPVEGLEIFTGHWTYTDVLTMEHIGGQFVGEWQFAVSLTGDTLRLTGADAEFDFDEDGVEDSARLNMTAIRN
jgi:hypothetical protein